MPPVPHDARTATPPELLNNDPRGFAWKVWHDRTPKLVAQIRDALPFGPQQRAALDALLMEVECGLISPLGPHAHDRQQWEVWGAPYFGTSWQDAPFLWSESFFYRRLLDAVGFFEPGPWRWVDPFEFLKAAELRDPGLQPDLEALDRLTSLGQADQDRAMLLSSLWGNRADLGFWIGASRNSDAAWQGALIADQSAELWAALRRGDYVVVVADNAGRELLSDLLLIDHLLRHRAVAAVSLHVKPHPYYVSDATTTDVAACLRRLAEAGGSAAETADRLHAALAAGQLTVGTHEYYCAPWSFHRMPADLGAQLGKASLVMLKGDLNYRRLVGDRSWPPDTPFGDVTSYFPSPVAALRTLKSDVVTGLDRAGVEDLDATGEAWRTDGNHGLIQVSS